MMLRSPYLASTTSWPHLGHGAGRHHPFSCWVPTVLHPSLWRPQHLKAREALVRQGPGEPAREELQGTLVFRTHCGWGEGSTAARSHLRGQAPPCWEPECPVLGHRLPLGCRNTHNLPKLQGQPADLREAAPCKGPTNELL